MDLVSISIILGAVIAGAAGLQHFYDRYAKRGLYSRTLRTSKEGLEALRTELQGLRDAFGATISDGEASQDPLGLDALKSNFMDLPNKIQAAVRDGLIEASKIALTGASPLADDAPMGMEAVQPMGSDAAAEKKLSRSLKAAVGADALGPYGPVLEQFAPTTYAWLRDHPEMVMWALQQPWLQSVIQKAASLVSQATGGGGASGQISWGV